MCCAPTCKHLMCLSFYLNGVGEKKSNSTFVLGAKERIYISSVRKTGKKSNYEEIDKKTSGLLLKILEYFPMSLHTTSLNSKINNNTDIGMLTRMWHIAKSSSRKERETKPNPEKFLAKFHYGSALFCIF